MEARKFDREGYEAFKGEMNRAFAEFRERWTFRAQDAEEFEAALLGMRQSEGTDVEVEEYFEHCYVEKAHKDGFAQLRRDWHSMLMQRMAFDDFCRGAFLSEMFNHDWQLRSITADCDVIAAFAPCELLFFPCESAEDYLEQAGLSGERYARLYREAGDECRRISAEKGWSAC